LKEWWESGQVPTADRLPPLLQMVSSNRSKKRQSHR